MFYKQMLEITCQYVNTNIYRKSTIQVRWQNVSTKIEWVGYVTLSVLKKITQNIVDNYNSNAQINLPRSIINTIIKLKSSINP